MRVAVLIIGVVLVLLLFPLTYLFYELSRGVGDESSERAAAIGMVMLAMWLIACGFVLSRPLVSAAVFVLAGLLGFAMGGGFPILDPWVGPAISIALAMLSYVARGGKKERRRLTIERARPDER